MELPVWAAAALAYLIGSIDFAIFVARLHGVDIRSEGSGNPGTANVFRVVGIVPGIVVLVGDLLKGLVAAYLGWLAAGSVDPVGSWVVMLAGTAAVIGHCYPVFHRFRGGKGMATLFGAMLFILPLVTVVAAVVWGLVARVAKFPAAGSCSVAVAYLPVGYWQGMDIPSLSWLLLSVLLILYRHKSNLVTWRERRSGSDTA
ncbi:MAG: glycerol-3-phosphate acyltransferase [bacterium]|nr:glycerol-3-phosphate acyltransferase [bacterium]MDE0500317.1 glycerol-3-phosphate acyltransferase [bacterium]